MEDARDIIARQSRLEQTRRDYEPVWRDVAEYCAPDAPEILRSGFALSRHDNQAARTDRRTRRVYDATVRQGQRRLSAGLESLITPQNEKWHGLTTAAMDDEETDEEREWAEKVRDFLFSIRYSPGSGYVPAMQSCYANIVRFGPAYLYAEEDFSGRYIRYRSLPVGEVWIARNRWGEVDTLHRKYKRSARVCYQLFGEKLPAKIIEMAKKPSQMDEQVELIQSISPNHDRKTFRLGTDTIFLDGPYRSAHVVVDGEKIVKEKDFQSFPVACFNWGRDDGDDYGTSPIIELLTEVREINAVRKGTLRALQGITDPALALGNKVDWLPPLDPGSRHPGLINDRGELMAQPIVTGARPDYAFQYIEQSRQTIQEGLYVNLFQTLVSKPSNQTATEALIRQEEKGALLGPAGSSIQGGLAMQTDRELSILEVKGLYEPDSRFAPPASLSGKSIRVNFTSPLDILRKAAEAKAVVEVWAFAGQLAQAKPEVLDNMDADESLRVFAEAGRSPARILKRKEEVEEDRAAKAKAATAQQGMAAMAGAAQIAKDAVPAMAQAADAGLIPNLGAAAQ
ncbi:portal protein [Tardiphaga sp.]|jgi:hypothetical protein|uniref:portal protein n=1 Tax=Tardiphaga sp. TaxID=1926292 RepID=UPI0037D993CC